MVLISDRLGTVELSRGGVLLSGRIPGTLRSHRAVTGVTAGGVLGSPPSITPTEPKAAPAQRHACKPTGPQGSEASGGEPVGASAL